MTIKTHNKYKTSKWITYFDAPHSWGGCWCSNVEIGSVTLSVGINNHCRSKNDNVNVKSLTKKTCPFQYRNECTTK
jgi:hypothetical protein